MRETVLRDVPLAAVVYIVVDTAIILFNIWALSQTGSVGKGTLSGNTLHGGNKKKRNVTMCTL